MYLFLLRLQVFIPATAKALSTIMQERIMNQFAGPQLVNMLKVILFDKERSSTLTPCPGTVF